MDTILAIIASGTFFAFAGILYLRKRVEQARDLRLSELQSKADQLLAELHELSAKVDKPRGVVKSSRSWTDALQVVDLKMTDEARRSISSLFETYKQITDIPLCTYTSGRLMSHEASALRELNTLIDFLSDETWAETRVRHNQYFKFLLSSKSVKAPIFNISTTLIDKQELGRLLDDDASHAIPEWLPRPKYAVN